MQSLVRVAVIGVAVFAAGCSNGPRKGWDTIGAGAAPGESGGAPVPATSSSAAGSVAPTMTTDTAKKATDTAAKKRDTARKKP
jgi:hypothetical protein